MRPGKPTVSVLIPTYDRLHYLKEAVASVQAQTFPDWELIVVDDGSTDGTVAWLQALDDSRIRVLSLEHSGDLASLRNRGVDEAAGQYVAFLDSDDVWAPEKLQIQLAMLEAESEARWSYTAMRRMDAQGKEIRNSGVAPWRPISGWILEELLTLRAIVGTPTILVERDLVHEVGGFDPKVGSWITDYDLIFRLGTASPAVAVDETLTWVRVHRAAHSSDRAAAHLGWTRLYRKMETRVPPGRLRRICRRESRRHRLSLASRLAEAGHRWEALGEVLPVVARRPWTFRAWRVLLWHVVGKGTLRLARRRDSGSVPEET